MVFEGVGGLVIAPGVQSFRVIPSTLRKDPRWPAAISNASSGEFNTHVICNRKTDQFPAEAVNHSSQIHIFMPGKGKIRNVPDKLLVRPGRGEITPEKIIKDPPMRITDSTTHATFFRKTGQPVRVKPKF